MLIAGSVVCNDSGKCTLRQPESEQTHYTPEPSIPSTLYPGHAFVAVAEAGAFKPTLRAAQDMNRLNGKRVKPNAACPCGSGRKFKKCCRATGDKPAADTPPAAEDEGDEGPQCKQQ